MTHDDESDALAGLSADQVIERMGLEHLEGEGVWIRVIGRSDAGSAIYALLTPTDFSALHLLQEDELWVHVAGSPIAMTQLRADGSVVDVRLGRALGESLHAIVPAGTWQGSTTAGEWTLVVCSLAPPFSGFVLADSTTDLSSWALAPIRRKELIRG